MKRLFVLSFACLCLFFFLAAPGTAGAATAGAESPGVIAAYNFPEISRAEGEGVQCTISSYTDAPAHNQAYLSFAADASSGGKGRLQGNHIVYEEDTSCAVEILLFSDFAVVRYLEGKRCNGWFGMNATVEGIFLRQKEK